MNAAADARTGAPIRLGTWPTPLEAAPRLASAIGVQPDRLWIKRDDLTGLGAGGNKVRKLQWTCAEAVASGARTLVTSGAPQSNHARLTAAAGARLGLDVVLVLGGTPSATRLTGNQALNALFGATVVWSGDRDVAVMAARVDEVADALRAAGRRPAVIPYGGSTPSSTAAYLEVAGEIRAQGVDPDHVVVAVGSGGTMAGLLRGFGANRVLGVDTGAVRDPHRAVRELLPAADPVVGDLRMRTDQVGRGYAEVTDDVMSALALAARTEGVVLDPVYTGRALAGLIAEIEDGGIAAGSSVVLVHTGGLPGLFGSEAFLDGLGQG